MTATFVGGNANGANSTSVTVTMPGGIQAGDIALIAHPYSPTVAGGTDPTTPVGWTQLDTQDWSASYRARLYGKVLTGSETAVQFTNGSQKLTATLGVWRGVTAIHVNGFRLESVAGLTHTAATATATAQVVTAAFITERESTPSTVFTPPSGFTMGPAFYLTGGGATCAGLAYNLTPTTGTIGGGSWGEDVSNDALVLFVVGLQVPLEASASLAATASAAATASTTKAASGSLAATGSMAATAAIVRGGSASLAATASASASADVIPGSGGGPVVVVQEPDRPRSFRIEVFDENLNKLGRVGRYLTCDLTLKHLDIGSWGLLMNLDEQGAVLLQEPGRRITVDFEEANPDGSHTRLLSGPVYSSEVTVDETGQRTIAFAGYDDKWWLDQRIAYQSPAMSFPTLGTAFTQAAYVDIRSGTGEGVAKAFVTANAITRLNMPHLTVAPNLGRGTTVSFNARMHSLLWMVTIATTYSGLGFRVDQVGSNLVFDVYDPTDRPVRLSTKLGNLSAYKILQTGPAATFVAGGGTGENTARKYMQGSLPSSAVGWGVREKYLDASDAATDADLQARITDYLLQSGPTAGFSLTPRDTKAMRFGRDYNIGDKVVVELEGGLEVSDTVREVKLSHTSADGMTIVPGIGYSQSTDPTAAIYRSYRALRDEVANMKRSV